jgi:hypothetical protein
MMRSDVNWNRLRKDKGIYILEELAKMLPVKI